MNLGSMLQGGSTQTPALCTHILQTQETALPPGTSPKVMPSRCHISGQILRVYQVFLPPLIIWSQEVPVQSLSRVWLFVTPWTAAHQASLSITISQRLLKLMSIELVMPSNHLVFCHPLLLLPSVFPSIRIFSNESALRIRRPTY